MTICPICHHDPITIDGENLQCVICLKKKLQMCFDCHNVRSGLLLYPKEIFAPCCYDLTKRAYRCTRIQLQVAFNRVIARAKGDARKEGNTLRERALSKWRIDSDAKFI